jgi:hypothetical protein
MKKVAFVAIVFLVAGAVFVVRPYVLLPVKNGAVSCDGALIKGARIYRHGEVIIAKLPSGKLVGADLRLGAPISCDSSQYWYGLGVLASPSDDAGLYCHGLGAIGDPLFADPDGSRPPPRPLYLATKNYASFPAECGQLKIEY